MKRIFALFLTLILMLISLPVLADTQPGPVSTIPYEELPENRDGIHHYLLLCMDQWSGGLKDNNDGIVLLTLDTRAGRIMLTSILRDSLVERPDGKIGRINYIVKNFGPDELCKVISTHLGIKVDKYVIFNFQQIANIVDPDKMLFGHRIISRDENGAIALGPASQKDWTGQELSFLFLLKHFFLLFLGHTTQHVES